MTIKLLENISKGEFVINAVDNSIDNYYIQEATLDGKPDTQLRVPFADIVKGGTLDLKMGKEPKKQNIVEVLVV